MLVYWKKIPLGKDFSQILALQIVVQLQSHCQKFHRLEKPELKSFPGIIKNNRTHGNPLKNKTANRWKINCPKNQKHWKTTGNSNAYTITRFLFQQLLTLSLNMLVQCSNATSAFWAWPYSLFCGTPFSILHNQLLNRISLMCQSLLLQYLSRIWMCTQSVDIDPHASHVTLLSSTEASIIIALQVGHFTAVSNDFISTEQVFADFITFPYITSSTNCTSRIGSLSNMMVELEVVLKYLLFW